MYRGWEIKKIKEIIKNGVHKKIGVSKIQSTAA